LQKLNVYAGQKIIQPFDFSKARNYALDALPNTIDVVVSIDMDERLKPGWRKELEKVWKQDVEVVNYTYISDWQDDKKTIPAVSCWRSKIFKKKGFRWINNIHEIPMPEEKRNPIMINCENIVVYHYQTGKRNYIELLTENIKKYPDTAALYIQRASDYMRQENWSKGIEDYEMYIALVRKERLEKNISNADYVTLTNGQISHAYIEIARAKMKMKFPVDDVIKNLLFAVAESPDMREAWVYLADGWMSVGNFGSAYAAAMNALQITQHGIHAKELICWGDYPKKLADQSFAKIVKGIIFNNSINK
jgi:tetratricopeptide (TPR) repeat protein